MLDSDDKGFLDFLGTVIDALNKPPWTGSGGIFDRVKRFFGGIFTTKSFNGQNQVINKSTGQVVSCNELKSFITDEYNKYLQNPRDYERNNFNQNQNIDGGYGGGYGGGNYNGQNVGYGWGNNNGYGVGYGGGYGK